MFLSYPERCLLVQVQPAKILFPDIRHQTKKNRIGSSVTRGRQSQNQNLQRKLKFQRNAAGASLFVNFRKGKKRRISPLRRLPKRYKATSVCTVNIVITNIAVNQETQSNNSLNSGTTLSLGSIWVKKSLGSIPSNSQEHI